MLNGLVGMKQPAHQLFFKHHHKILMKSTATSTTHEVTMSGNDSRPTTTLLPSTYQLPSTMSASAIAVSPQTTPGMSLQPTKRTLQEAPSVPSTVTILSPSPSPPLPPSPQSPSSPPSQAAAEVSVPAAISSSRRESAPQTPSRKRKNNGDMSWWETRKHNLQTAFDATRASLAHPQSIAAQRSSGVFLVAPTADNWEQFIDWIRLLGPPFYREENKKWTLESFKGFAMVSVEAGEAVEEGHVIGFAMMLDAVEVDGKGMPQGWRNAGFDKRTAQGPFVDVGVCLHTGEAKDGHHAAWGIFVDAVLGVDEVRGCFVMRKAGEAGAGGADALLGPSGFVESVPFKGLRKRFYACVRRK